MNDRPDRETILARSRKEGVDEGFNAAEDRGRLLGSAVFFLVFAFLAIFDLCTGQSYYGITALFFAFLAAQSYPLYRFTKKKAYLVVLICGSIACVIDLIQHVLEVLG